MANNDSLRAACSRWISQTDPDDYPAQAIILTVNGGRYQVDFARCAAGQAGTAAPAPASPEPARPRGFSPTEKAIIDALADGEWKTSQAISEAAGLGRSSSFQAILTNLVDAKVIESSHKNGYRLSVPETDA